MRTKPFSNLREAFAEVRCKESKRKVIMRSQTLAESLDGSDFVTRGLPINNHHNENH